MKQILLLLALTIMSCDKNCDEDKKQLTETYQQGIRNANGNSAAVQEVTRQYNEKLNNLDCD